MEDNYREVKKAEPCLKLIHMDQVEVEEIEWLFYPFIPYGKVTIIQGDPGEGKTTVVLQIIAKLTKGEAILSETSEGKSEETGVEPINVIYQTAEDGLGDTIKTELWKEPPEPLLDGVECSAALHHNKTKTNYHIHLVFSERKMLEQPEVKIATRNMFYDEQGKHRRTKKEILDVQGNIRAGCSIIPKGEVYESHIFTKKEEWFKNKAFTKEVKELFTDTINCYVKEESEKLSVFQQGGVYLAMKKIGKNNPKAEEIKADNAARQEWNRTVDVALVEGVPEEDILKIKQEKITDETLQSIRTHGWLPDMFRQIIRGAKDFLQEVIFKFKLPPRTVPKIDLQEWKDMQKLMYELQGQSREIKRTQQDISSLKKQLSELRGLFKGKERKSLEGKIELLEDLEKRLHRSMGRIVKREGYPNVQSFQKVYNKAEELIMEYNEELRAWKNQTKPKKENPLEQPQKASVLEKLHRYQQEGRQQPKRSVKKKSMDRER